jgi:hypothetical protein
VIGDPEPVPVKPPGDEVTVYEVIVAPPLSEGAEKVTDAEFAPAVAVPMVGARGTLATTALVLFDIAGVEPLAFVAVTTQVITVPT